MILFISLIGADNFLNEMMSYDVTLGELEYSDAFYVGKYPRRNRKSTLFTHRKIGL